MRAHNFVGCVRARGLPARQPARMLISRALWLLNARPVAKTDALIVPERILGLGMARRASLGAKFFRKSEIIRNTQYTAVAS